MGRLLQRTISSVDHVSHESKHGHQEHDGEPEEVVHAANPGVLVHPERDEQEGDVEREEEEPEPDRRGRRGRLKRDRDVSQDDGHLAHPRCGLCRAASPKPYLYQYERMSASAREGNGRREATAAFVYSLGAGVLTLVDARDAFMAQTLYSCDRCRDEE